MNSSAEPETSDPVRRAMESLLNELEKQGMGRLEKRCIENLVTLKFGEFSVESSSCDIAFVRLAMVMLDDPRYSCAVSKALRGLMASDKETPV